MSFWDWKSGHRFQSLDTTAQPGSLDAEAGIMSSTFDRSGLRLICGEADKTSKSLSHQKALYLNPVMVLILLAVKIWKPDEKASEETHPLEWTPSLGRRKF
jgi:pleiotropic regulator 1